MYVVVSQTLFMQLRRVVGPFSTEAEAEEWVHVHWNEYETCSVIKVEEAQPYRAGTPYAEVPPARRAGQKESAS